MDAGRSAGPTLVLLVENHDDTLEMYREWFNLRGYRVACSRSADDALRLAAELHPDIITTELALACSDGSDLCEALHTDARTRGIPVVAITSWATDDDVRRARQLGCDAVLVKPVLPEVIAEELQRVLNARARPRITAD